MMHDYTIITGAKRGKRRALEQRRTPRAHLPLLSGSCVLLAIFLLSLTFSEATGASQSHNRNTRQFLDNGNYRIRQLQPLRIDRRGRRSRNENANTRTLDEAPTPTPGGHIPEKPSLEHHVSSHAPERNDTKSRFSVNLSVAIVDQNVSSSTNNREFHKQASSNDTTNFLLVIRSVLDTIIVNDTEYELHDSSSHSKANTTSQEDDDASKQTTTTGWVYTLKTMNVTAKERDNATACLVVDSNDTIMVTWIKVKVDYHIIPQRRSINDTSSTTVNSTQLVHGPESSSTNRNSDSEDNVFSDNSDPLLEHTETERSSSSAQKFDLETVGSTVVNATRDRIDDGSILEWIQQDDLSVVGISHVGLENETRCLVVDMNSELKGPIPFIDPLDLKSWDSVQMLGTIMFVLTLLGTSSLCLIGRNRSKAVRIEHWSAAIGDEAAVNDFLTLSSRFLPPECVNRRDANGATIVTIPSAECEPAFSIQAADEIQCRGSNHECR